VITAENFNLPYNIYIPAKGVYIKSQNPT